MTDETWKGVLIWSVPPTNKWLPVIPSLYSLSSGADVISTLIAHGMILDRGSRAKPTSGSSSMALTATTSTACMNPNCKAKKRSTHTTANCYWPGGGKEGQFPPNFGQRTQANVASSTLNGVEHFVLSAIVPDRLVNSGVVVDDDDDEPESTKALVSKDFQAFNDRKVPTFIDSDTMFVSKSDFSAYKATHPRSGDSTKAVDGNFDIIGEGTVVKGYLVDGKEKKLIYIWAIHTPTLNANLVSVSAFDHAGLTLTFGGSCGIVWKHDRTAILAARLVRGMYVVDEFNGALPDQGIAIAMTSLSQPVSLEQWHR